MKCSGTVTGDLSPGCGADAELAGEPVVEPPPPRQGQGAEQRTDLGLGGICGPALTSPSRSPLPAQRVDFLPRSKQVPTGWPVAPALGFFPS